MGGGWEHRVSGCGEVGDDVGTLVGGRGDACWVGMGTLGVRRVRVGNLLHRTTLNEAFSGQESFTARSPARDFHSAPALRHLASFSCQKS